MPRTGSLLISVLAGSLSAVSALLSGGAAADVGSPPTFVATIGGSGAAQLYPSGLEIAPNGDLVVADTGNNRISEFSTTGSLVRQVGSYGSGTGQFNNPRDVGIDSAGNVYVADTGNTRIVKLSPTGAWITSWRAAGAETIKSPIGISVHNDLIYVADGGALAVRVFDTSGTQLRKIVSNGACTFAAPRDADADSAGNIYVANYTRNTILKLTATGTCITAWGAKGSGAGQFANPYGIRIAPDPWLREDVVYVADSNNERIQVFTESGSYLAQMGVPGSHDTLGTFTQLRRVAVAANGDVWGADLWGWRVERFARSLFGWSAVQQIGTDGPQLSDTAAFHEPRQISFDAAGNLSIADTVDQRIVKFSAAGHVLGSCGQRGSTPGRFNWPRGNAVDVATGDLWVADTKQFRLQVLNSSCAAAQILGAHGTSTGDFNWPMSIAIRQSDRTLWVADTNNNRITVWDLNSRTPLVSYGGIGSGSGQFNQPRGISVGPDGHIWVADRSNDRVVELSAGPRATSITWVRDLSQSFKRPEDVAVGSGGRIYVADTLNNRLVVLDPDGSLRASTSGPTGLSGPAAVAIGPDGLIYVADTINDRIQVFSP